MLKRKEEFKYTMKRCWAEKYCKLFNEQRTNCHEYCIGYVQLNNVYTLSNMPKRFQHDIPLIPDEVDYEAFVYLKDWKDKVEKKVENGEGLFIYGKTKGTGKTTWACKIMNEYFKNVALGNNLRCRGLFVNVPRFFQELKNSFDNPSDEFNEFMENIKKADLVIWDDIGTESPTRFVRDTLYTFIDYRYANQKSQIFTSNESLEQMEDENWLGDRTVSRIVGSCDIVELKTKSDKRVE